MGNVPPFFETDAAVVVGVYLGEEGVQVAVRHRQPCATQSCAELGFRYLAVVVVVDALEQR
jgi:hypothetical protein